MSYKKRLIVLVCAIFVYMCILFLYNKINNDNCIEVLVLNNDVTRGENLESSDFNKVIIKDKNLFVEEEVLMLEDVQNFVLRKDLTKGAIVLKKDLIEKSKYNTIDEQTEIISVNISNSDDIVSYQIEKNSIVNLYYTGKYSLAKNILKDLNLPNVSTKNDNINKMDGEYITVKLVENIKILDLFDKYGNVVDTKNYNKNESNKIDTIMFNANNDMIMKIKNLKNYGEFSISVVK